jgi:hypothetical protein
VELSGEFDSLEPLRGLNRLTHIHIVNSRVKDLTPLSGLFALRVLLLGSNAEELDLTPLESLPALHYIEPVRKSGNSVETHEMMRGAWQILSSDVCVSLLNARTRRKNLSFSMICEHSSAGAGRLSLSRELNVSWRLRRR